MAKKSLPTHSATAAGVFLRSSGPGAVSTVDGGRPQVEPR
jgi:hypothetical protein